MSDRSELMKLILRTWEGSGEGQRYLEWFLQPGADTLDGGAVLRESVLDVMEEDKQLDDLRSQRRTAGLEPLLARLPPEKRALIEKNAEGITAAIELQVDSIRQGARALREIRRELNLERFEALDLVSKVMSETESPDEISKFFANSQIAQEVAAKVAVLSRTRADSPDIEAEWEAHSSEDPWTDAVKGMVDDPGVEWFDNHREKFDRYYAQQMVVKLEGIVDRVAKLMPVRIEVQDQHVTRMFREAHDSYLFGFDAASIALCRSLVEHALKDKLSIRGRDGLNALIGVTERRGFMKPATVEAASKVQASGNKIMHDMSGLRHTAEEVLGYTRQVLLELYGIPALP